MASAGTGSGTFFSPGRSSPAWKAAATACRSSRTRAGVHSIAPGSSVRVNGQELRSRGRRRYSAGALADRLSGGGEVAAELIDLSLAQAQTVPQLAVDRGWVEVGPRGASASAVAATLTGGVDAARESARGHPSS